MRYVAIDFETASGSRSSACALAAVRIDGGKTEESIKWLIQPPGNEYNPFNTQIHGMRSEHTETAPTFPAVYEEFRKFADGSPLVAHNAAFDMSVLRASFDFYGMPHPELDYYCTMIMARAHWPELHSYSLPIVACRCGFSLQHHDPMEDARACALVGLQIAKERSESDIDHLAQVLSMRPGHISGYGYSPCSGPMGRHRARKHTHSVKDFVCQSDAVSPGHAFYDCDIVFTGQMVSMIRDDAMQSVVNVGGRPRTSVSRFTEYLVVGAVDFERFVNGSPSGKLKKALLLSEAGAPIEIISETDFLQML